MAELLGEFPSESELPNDAAPVAAPPPQLQPPPPQPPPQLQAGPQPPQPRQPPPQPERQLQPGDSVSVAELLAKSVGFEWYEAIAISQGLCARLGESAGHVQFQAEDVFIDAAGGVSVRTVAGAGGPPALEQVAGLLRTMLADRNVPTPLRLAVLQSSSAGSLEEWSSTIEYFERPNREALIKAVYQRAVRAQVQTAVLRAAAPQQSQSRPMVSLPPTPPSHQSQTKPAVSPPSLPPSLPVVSKAPSWRMPVPTAKHIAAACGAAAVAAALGVGAWMIQRELGQGPATAVSDVTSALEPEASLSGAVTDRSAGAAAAQITEPPMPVPKGQWIHLEPLKESPRPRTKPTVSAPSEPPTVAQSVLVVVPSSAEVPIHESPAGETPARLDPTVGSTPVSPPSAVSYPSSSPAASVIYSRADADVVPPSAIYPRFPSTLPAGVNPDNVAEFDVVVNESGRVDSVRVRRLPATMSEAMRVTMGLSAAKAWRFSPGTRNGEPVKYRQIVWVLTN